MEKSEKVAALIVKALIGKRKYQELRRKYHEMIEEQVYSDW